MKEESGLKIALYDEESVHYQGKAEKVINTILGSEKQKRVKRLNKYITKELGEKVMVFQEVLDKATQELGYEELRMFTYLLSICGYENFINISQKEIALKYKTKQPAVSRAIGNLVKKGYIDIKKINNQNTYRLSPKICWKGSFFNHKKALLDIRDK